uniref:DNA-directed RNA polymerase III subunit RPC5 n=1 Tax=Arcella intermedia TaxID=1963864 RepID=A0A6B2KZC2_9EUKA
MDIEPSGDPDFGDDEVLQTIDVYLNHQASGDICFFQYPLRPPWRPYDPVLRQETRIKPHSQVIEIDYGIPAEQLGSAVDDDNMREHHTIRSTTVDLKTNYAIGLYKDNKLHITPLKYIYQMRPDFSYIDDAEEKRRKAAEKKADKPEAEEVKVVSVQARQETEHARMLREKSWAFLKAKEESEQWRYLTTYDRETSETTEVFESLVTPSELFETFQVPFNVTKEKYLSVLNPPPAVINYGDDIEPDIKPVKPFFEIKQLSLADQVCEILKNAHIVTYTELKNLLLGDSPTIPEEQNLVGALAKFAVLIRGTWILKSAYIPMKTDRYGAIRNYILVTFALDSEFVSPRELSITISVDPTLLMNIMEPFCTATPGLGWHLRKGPDTEFLNYNLKLGKDYQKIYLHSWQKNRPSIIEEVNKSKDQVEHKDEDDKKSKARQVTKASLAVAFSELRKPEEKELLNFVFSLLEEYGLMNMTNINQKVLEAEKNKKFKELKKEQISTDLIHRILNKCTTVINSYYLLQTTGDSEADKYREFVISLYEKQPSYTKQEIDDACLAKFNQKMSIKTFAKVMRQLAYFKNTRWTFKAAPTAEVPNPTPSPSPAPTTPTPTTETTTSSTPGRGRVPPGRAGRTPTGRAPPAGRGAPGRAAPQSNVIVKQEPKE